MWNWQCCGPIETPLVQWLGHLTADGTVRVWHVERTVEVAVVGVHGDWVDGVAWSPSGQHVAAASRDCTAKLWEAAFDLKTVLEKARSRTFRRLTSRERQSVMLPELAASSLPNQQHALPLYLPARPSEVGT